MPPFTQEQRFLKITTPLSPDALLVERITGTEALSQPFSFSLDLLAPQPVPFEQVLGQDVTVSVAWGDNHVRYFSGIINEFSQGHELTGVEGPATFIRYRATLVPKLWLLTRRRQCRIWQSVSVPDILRAMLVTEWGLDVAFELTSSYAPRNYCVQYRESDFDFASRLMEEEGITYYFQHREGGHTLVLGDTLQGTQPTVGNPEALVFDPSAERGRAYARVTSWEKVQQLRSCRMTLRDHCFEMPNQSLEASSAIVPSAVAGRVKHALATNGANDLESFDYPGNYAHHFDGVSPGGGDQSGELPQIFDVNRRLTTILAEAEAAQALRIRGASTYPHLLPGHVFQLDRHFDGDGGYRLVRVEHEISLAGAFGLSAIEPELVCRNRFTCLPAGLPFRPERVTPRPRVGGSQTATVVGIPGQPIYCDKYGRIKVQFHWDRLGQNNENSSCWLRVAQPWAGQGWGATAIPRIGQEVLVDFLEGDPDRPIVVGSVYNAEQVTPFELPANNNLHVLKSESLNGDAGNYSGLAFNDRLGQEVVHLHSEKDMLVSTENNRQELVGANEALQIASNHTVQVGGMQTLEVGADRIHQVGGDQIESISGVHSHMVGGMYQLTVGGGSPPSPPPPTTTQEIFKTGMSTADGHVAYSPKAGVFLTTVYGSSTTFTLGLGMNLTLGGTLSLTAPFATNVTLGASATITKGYNIVTSLGGITQATPKGITMGAGEGIVMTAGIVMNLLAPVLILKGDSVELKSGVSTLRVLPAAIELRCGASSLIVRDGGITFDTPDIRNMTGLALTV